MTTTIANFKPLNFFEWRKYITQQVTKQYTLVDGMTYSDVTKSVYNSNGSLYGIDGELDVDSVVVNAICTCGVCNGTKELVYLKNGYEVDSIEKCNHCDDMGRVLMQEIIKIR